MGTSLRDLYMLKRRYEDPDFERDATGIDGMKRSRFWEFWRRRRWMKEVERARSDFRKVLVAHFMDVN